MVKAKDASTAVGRSAGDAYQSGVNAVKDGALSTTKTVTEPIRRMRENFNGKKIAKWIWWWSLAAIGVYGVATTVPKELIRQVFQSRGDGEEDKKAR